jgi:uncharacterized protein
MSLSTTPRSRRTAWVAPLILCAAAVCAPVHAATRQVVTIATAGVQGVYFPLGGAVCRMVNATRKQHGLRCTVAHSEGSVANIRAVLAGDVALGVAQSDMQYHARRGEAPFANAPQPKLRALFSVYPELFTVMARSDADIRSFADLKGKRVSVGTAGSGTRATMELAMKAFGVRRADLRTAAELKFVELAPALCENKIDAFVFVAGHPNPVFQDAVTACGARFVPVAGAPVDALVAERPYYARADIPAKLYRPGDAAQPTFGTMASLVVSEDMPEATAYAITKAVFDNFDDFRKLHPALADVTKQAMVKGQAVPLHPGALRYFREAGLM